LKKKKNMKVMIWLEALKKLGVCFENPHGHDTEANPPGQFTHRVSLPLTALLKMFSRNRK
jgi:hypothetical protein